MTSAPTIIVAAIVFHRADGTVLTVRKRGTSAFMLPGGKPEAGESGVDTALREVREELGIVLRPSDLRLVGSFATHAANEAGHALHATVFETAAEVEPAVQAEIEEARWVEPAAAIREEAQAPLNRAHVFPLLTARAARRGD